MPTQLPRLLTCTEETSSRDAIRKRRTEGSESFM
jgi:hypothetical protein